MSDISQVPAQSLALLMNKDPKTISDDEVAQITKILREARSHFVLEDKKPKGAKKAAAQSDLSFGDLEI